MKMPLTARLVVTLTGAGLLSGLVIVGAYELTLPRIEANKAERLRAAVFEVLPGTATMEPAVWDGSTLGPLREGTTDDGATVFAGYDDRGQLIGWAIPAEGAGFQDTIGLIYGWNPATRRIIGMRVLESRETPGLGDRIIKDQAFVSTFDDLAADPAIVVVKGGANEAWQVDAITGATISSKAVVKIINRHHALWSDRLDTPEPSKEPSSPTSPAPPSPRAVKPSSPP